MTTPEGVRLIRLECGKANAIDDGLLDTLRRELDKALEDEARAVVLTGYDEYFSAGLNLKSLPNTRKGMLAFAEKFERGLIHLWQFPLPTVAAVNGHAVAGGCVLACTCDLRIGAEGSFRVGLTEVDVGVPFPSAALAVVEKVVSHPWVTDLILGARLLGPTEARQSGILHLVTRPEELVARSHGASPSLGLEATAGIRANKKSPPRRRAGKSRGKRSRSSTELCRLLVLRAGEKTTRGHLEWLVQSKLITTIAGDGIPSAEVLCTIMAGEVMHKRS